MKKFLTIGDADGLIAYINPHDANNTKANTVLSFLEEQQATLYFPTTTIAEAITTLQRKYASPPLAQKLIDQCRAGTLQFITVDETVISLAVTLFNPRGSKQDTFFDAIVAAAAKLHHADAIFSFDAWYTKIGLTLAGDVLKQQKAA